VIGSSSAVKAAIFGGLAGALAISLTTLFVGISLALSEQSLIPAVKLVFVAHIPVMVIEGLLSAAAVYLIYTVKPELFHVMNQLNEPHIEPEERS
jgi:cobalt/nickel transport system permease protein